MNALLKDEKSQWKRISDEIGDIKKQFSKKTELGARRSEFGEAQDVDVSALEQELVVKEPITVIISNKGWIRAMRGHIDAGADELKRLSFKEGDGLKQSFHASSTDQLLLFTTTGRFYTLGADKLPSARGHGEPLRILVDMGNDSELVWSCVYESGQKFLICSTSGHGFIVKSDDVIANTRKGKQILNVKLPIEAVACSPIPSADYDQVAVVGTNKKLLVFGLSELPEMSRGKGIKLQNYSKGDILSDARVFMSSDGLTWGKGGLSAKELSKYVGSRAQAGKVIPKGFPRNCRFG